MRTDTKTLRLLKTVPVLNQCSVVFSPVNSALYAISMEREMDDGDSSFDSSLKIIDSSDYSSIGIHCIHFLRVFINAFLILATIDVKKDIYDMSVNSFDTQILLVENQGIYKAIQESVVRLYDVGRRRDDEDEQVNLMFGLLCDKLLNVKFKDQEEDDDDDDLDNDNSDDDRSDGGGKLLISFDCFLRFNANHFRSCNY